MCLSDEEVRKAQHESIFSQWQAEAVKNKAASYAELSLASLYKRPPLVWQVRKGGGGVVQAA